MANPQGLAAIDGKQGLSAFGLTGKGQRQIDGRAAPGIDANAGLEALAVSADRAAPGTNDSAAGSGSGSGRSSPPPAAARRAVFFDVRAILIVYRHGISHTHYI